MILLVSLSPLSSPLSAPRSLSKIEIDCPINAHNITMKFINTSIEQLESSIRGAWENHGCLTYWHLHEGKMMYIAVDEQTKYHRELKQIVKSFRNGGFKAVKAGEDITVGDIKVYSLLLEIDEAACPAYFLLRRLGESDDLYFIPYFFKTMKSRDKALQWIMKKTTGTYGDDYPERQTLGVGSSEKQEVCSCVVCPIKYCQ